ncbi:ArpU family phage packaging/lysis transcriptional regulator [Fructilactobacillus florum]|uniref:Phage transcriptional regulator, ArpU family n=1 Tax=Fructilactobacillus florum DSM 22689 = JCM 16035 TaxID=1423745 RepID=A0A0R2CJP7_9LACO|nr:ArpU family phage packaging/lysis transcriptional regulator [Fructilactobacillus florum]KRM91703.1 hypothetical protein FC87_GL000840 [Fructilactobacillus florum DSM 22689 = JCM 16035]
MELIDEIDERKTITNVKKWLNFSFPKLVMSAGLDAASLKSPSITDMPTDPTHGNANEAKVIRMIDNQQKVSEVMRALRGYKHTSKVILYGIYVDNISNWQLADKLGYSHTRFNELKSQALLEFAYIMQAYNYKLIVKKG